MSFTFAPKRPIVRFRPIIMVVTHSIVDSRTATIIFRFIQNGKSTFLLISRKFHHAWLLVHEMLLRCDVSTFPTWVNPRPRWCRRYTVLYLQVLKHIVCSIWVPPDYHYEIGLGLVSDGWQEFFLKSRIFYSFFTAAGYKASYRPT